jgi:hypothetical protein
MNQKHQKEIRQFVADGDFEQTEGGILVHGGLMARGKYTHTVNGEDEQIDYNLIPAAGILHVLDVVFGATAKTATWYLALFSGNATPDSTWTAANWVATATENTSTSEGYLTANRPTFVDAPAAAGVIGNVASKASYTIAASTTATFYGASLCSIQTRGAVTGVLASSVRFASTRVIDDGDTFEVGYTVELTDS